MLNKTLTTILVLIIIASSNLTSHAQNTAVMSSMTASTYSPQRSGEQNREIALTQFIGNRSYYNEDGYLIEFQQFNGKNEMFERTSYTVDEDGKVTYSVTVSNQGIIKTYTNPEYDNEDNLIVNKIYDNTNKLIREENYEYNGDGNLISKTITNVPANVSRLTEYEYNNEDELTREIVYDRNGDMKQIRNFVYDDEGREIDSDLQLANGEFTRFITTYDDNDNMLVQQWYDIDANLLQEDTYEYVYDINNNWTTSKRYTAGEMREVDERQIAYH